MDAGPYIQPDAEARHGERSTSVDRAGLSLWAGPGSAGIKRGARCADAGSSQRVPENTPDASRTSRPVSFPFDRTTRPEGFTIRSPVPPQTSRSGEPRGPKALRPTEPFRLKDFPVHAFTIPKDQNARFMIYFWRVHRNGNYPSAGNFLWIENRVTHKLSTSFPHRRGDLRSRQRAPGSRITDFSFQIPDLQKSRVRDDTECRYSLESFCL